MHRKCTEKMPTAIFLTDRFVSVHEVSVSGEKGIPETKSVSVIAVTGLPV